MCTSTEPVPDGLQAMSLFYEPAAPILDVWLGPPPWHLHDPESHPPGLWVKTICGLLHGHQGVSLLHFGHLGMRHRTCWSNATQHIQEAGPPQPPYQLPVCFSVKSLFGKIVPFSVWPAAFFVEYVWFYYLLIFFLFALAFCLYVCLWKDARSPGTGATAVNCWVLGLKPGSFTGTPPAAVVS